MLHVMVCDLCQFRRVIYPVCVLTPACILSWPELMQEAVTTLQAWLAASSNATASDRDAVNQLAALLKSPDKLKERGKRKQPAK